MIAAKYGTRESAAVNLEAMAVATVLAMDPDLLVLDEPTSNLDPAARRELATVLEALDLTMLLVTHDPADVDATIRKAMEINDVPVVIDFRVERDAMVWPMVPAGVSNDAIQIARDAAPEWDREESEAIEQSTDADHDGK